MMCQYQHAASAREYGRSIPPIRELASVGHQLSLRTFGHLLVCTRSYELSFAVDFELGKRISGYPIPLVLRRWSLAALLEYRSGLPQCRGSAA